MATPYNALWQWKSLYKKTVQPNITFIFRYTNTSRADKLTAIGPIFQLTSICIDTVSYELSGTLLEQVSRLLGDWAIFAWLFSKTKPPSPNGSADSRQKSKHWPYCTHGSYVSKLVDSQISSYRAFSINSQWLWYPTPNKHHGKHENDITTSKCVIIFFKNSTCKQANNSHVTHKLSCGFQWKTSIVFALLPTRSKTSPHSAHMSDTINSNATWAYTSTDHRQLPWFYNFLLCLRSTKSIWHPLDWISETSAQKLRKDKILCASMISCAVEALTRLSIHTCI